VLGFNPGDDRTIADWKQITDYFARLDKASDRVAVQTIGTSTLGRTMIAAFISAPENIRSLEKYKAIQARLADPRNVVTNAERDQLVRDGKTVVVISCSIHSTEIVASQMEMQLAYNLASASDPDTLSILRNTILILILLRIPTAWTLSPIGIARLSARRTKDASRQNSIITTPAMMIIAIGSCLI